jgi:hypothetical protein
MIWWRDSDATARRRGGLSLTAGRFSRLIDLWDHKDPLPLDHDH